MNKDILLIVAGALMGALLFLLICYFCFLMPSSGFVSKSDYVQGDSGFDGPIDDFIGEDESDFLDDSKVVELPWIYF